MLSHRLQVLLDDDRYVRITKLAAGRRTSVAAVIREAIDRGLPASPKQKHAAGECILTAPLMPVSEPVGLRSELDELRGRRG
jgi:hypothetical protein